MGGASRQRRTTHIGEVPKNFLRTGPFFGHPMKEKVEMKRFATMIGACMSLWVSACSEAPRDELGSGGSMLLEPLAAIDEVRPTQLANREAWRTYLVAQRQKQIAELRAYADKGSFAMNDEPGLKFVWRDQEGRLCAMAHLVAASGRTDIVNRVARDENDLQLASVKGGQLFDWMATSDLTREEIQLIQEPGFKLNLRTVEPVVVKPAEDAKRLAWEVARKRDHLRSVVERLEMDFDASIDVALSQLGDIGKKAPSHSS